MSAFATGAILTQKDDRDKQEAIGFHSQSFNNAEHNYNIHNCELLTVFWGLENWCHHLVGSPHPVTIYTDHKNLEYYQHPQSIS